MTNSKSVAYISLISKGDENIEAVHLGLSDFQFPQELDRERMGRRDYL